MKIRIMSEDNILALKTNISKINKNFKAVDGSWLYPYFGEDPFIDTKYDIEDFDLDMSSEEPFDTESSNTQFLYGKLKFLSDSQASDERLWAGLCLGPFWKYVQYRWPENTNNNIIQHYFFGFSPRRSIIRNALARLWWIGRLTYYDHREDCWELTKFICENSNFIMSVLERNYSNNFDIIHPFLSAVLDGRNAGLLVDTSIMKELTKYLDLLGGVYILDCLSEEVIYQKTYVKLLELSKSKKPEMKNQTIKD